MGHKDHTTAEAVLVTFGIDLTAPGGRDMLDGVLREAHQLTGRKSPNHNVDMRYYAMNAEVKARLNYHDRLTGGVSRGINRRIVKVSLDFVNDSQWSIYLPEDGYTNAISMHDWATFQYANHNIAFGAFLHINDELGRARINTHKCGYCGFHAPAQKGYTFCPECIGSPYLTEDMLHLTRMRAAGATGNRKPLSQAERDYLLPQYVEAQTKATTERQEKAMVAMRQRVLKEYEDTTTAALAQRDGMLWFLDRGLNVENLIYYSHTKRFSWGWRSPVSDSVRDRLLEIVSEFPYLYEIKCADGKTLSN